MIINVTSLCHLFMVKFVLFMRKLPYHKRSFVLPAQLSHVKNKVLNFVAYLACTINMTFDETHSLEERNKYSELKLGCLNSFINAVGLSLNEGFLSGMLFLFVIIIKLTVIMKVQLSVQGQKSDQRHHKKCPNVLLINTDDMAWGDISINNPSKLLPTPNIDKLVSKVNFLYIEVCLQSQLGY